MMEKIDSVEEETVEKAVEVLEEGEIFVYPTDTLYGLGTDATREDLVSKIFSLKQRGENNPVSVMVSGIEMMEEFAEISSSQKKTLKELLPGKVTVILDGKNLPENISPSGIGFRLPDHELSTKIVEEFGRPITSTSANPSGKKPAASVKEAWDYFDDEVSLYIDSGKLSGKSSTVVDLREEPEIVRKGAEVKKVSRLVDLL